MAEARPYVPALGRERLTGLYDPVLRLTTRERAFKERLLEQARIGPGMDVLDLGCGTGTLAIWASARQPEARFTGLDGDPKVIARAREKAMRAGVEVRFDVGLSDELPYADASFDRAVSSLFFHHLAAEGKRSTAQEVRRVLRPGGVLHVADWGPPTDPLMAALSLSIRLLDGFEPTRDNFIGALPALFEQEGMDQVRMHGRMRTVFGSLAFYSAARA